MDSKQSRAVKEYTKLTGETPLGSPKDLKATQINIRLNRKEINKLEKVKALALASINTTFQLGTKTITLEDVSPRKYHITKVSIARHLLSKALDELVPDED